MESNVEAFIVVIVKARQVSEGKQAGKRLRKSSIFNE